MNIAIRKEPDGSIYIDKNICNDNRFTEEILSRPPYNYSKVKVDNTYSDCIGFDFNEDLTFNQEKYLSRKQNEEREKKIPIITARLNELSQDFVQVQCGAIFDDIEERKKEFRTLHNELRTLQGKSKREYK